MTPGLVLWYSDCALVSETIMPPESVMEYRASELAAERIIHMVGTVAGASVRPSCSAPPPRLLSYRLSRRASSIRFALSRCSAARQPTNLASHTSRREFLRKLDHAAIFLMIAGTYTPFTTCRLHGVWAIGMTTAVWTGALTGAVMKLICPRRVEQVSTVVYLALGWIIVVGIKPLLSSVDVQTVVLIGVGGRALFHRDRLLSLAGATFPQRNMAQLRADRGQLSLRSCLAWGCVGPIVSHRRLTIGKAVLLTTMIRDGIDLENNALSIAVLASRLSRHDRGSLGQGG
jgi:hemolysin III